MASPDEEHSLLRSDRLSRDFVAVGTEDTVAQALEKICYACDPSGRLVGVVPSRKLIRASPEERISSLMFTRVVKLPAAPLVLAISDNITLLTYFTLVTRIVTRES